jgi:hypothetical protein
MLSLSSLAMKLTGRSTDPAPVMLDLERGRCRRGRSMRWFATFSFPRPIDRKIAMTESAGAGCAVQAVAFQAIHVVALVTGQRSRFENRRALPPSTPAFG